MNWAELWILHILVVTNDFAIHVLHLLSKTDLDIADFRHSETCSVVQWVLIDIEELKVLQDEFIHGWTFPNWMLDLVDSLLCFLAPFDT